MFRLEDLTLFVRAAALNSFSDAAREVGVQPAQVSSAIKRLESTLAIRLFARSTRSLRLTPTLGVMMVFRFVISPALGAALCALLGIGGLVRSVYVVELAMPVVTQTVVAAAEYGADEQLAAQGAAISTLACFVVTPVLMLLL